MNIRRSFIIDKTSFTTGISNFSLPLVISRQIYCGSILFLSVTKSFAKAPPRISILEILFDVKIHTKFPVVLVEQVVQWLWRTYDATPSIGHIQYSLVFGLKQRIVRRYHQLKACQHYQTKISGKTSCAKCLWACITKAQIPLAFSTPSAIDFIRFHGICVIKALRTIIEVIIYTSPIRSAKKDSVQKGLLAISFA